MSNDLLPVSPRDLRAALALCKAKFETEASAQRAALEEFKHDAECLKADWPDDDDNEENPDRIKASQEQIDSLDRMAAQVGALLRAPDMGAAFKSTFLVVGTYSDGQRWADAFATQTAEEAESLAPPKVKVAGVIRMRLVDGIVKTLIEA